MKRMPNQLNIRCARGGNRIRFSRDSNQFFGSISRDNLKYRIKNLIIQKNMVTIKTSINKFNSEMVGYYTYNDFNYSRLRMFSDTNKPDDYINNYTDDILDDLQACVTDYPEKYVHLVFYPIEGDTQPYYIMTIHYPFVANL